MKPSSVILAPPGSRRSPWCWAITRKQSSGRWTWRLCEWWSTTITSGDKHLHCNWGLRRRQRTCRKPSSSALSIIRPSPPRSSLNSESASNPLTRRPHPDPQRPTRPPRRHQPERCFRNCWRSHPKKPANTVIRKYRDATQFVEVADPGILLDVDEPATYEQLEKGSRQ